MWISDKGSLDVQMLLKEVKNVFSIQSRGCSYCIATVCKSLIKTGMNGWTLLMLPLLSIEIKWN